MGAIGAHSADYHFVTTAANGKAILRTAYAPVKNVQRQTGIK
jgi:hypothetical protein